MAQTLDLLTREDLAHQLGVSVRTLDRWHALREGPPRTSAGRRPLYRREAVEDWIASREGFDRGGAG